MDSVANTAAEFHIEFSKYDDLRARQELLLTLVKDQQLLKQFIEFKNELEKRKTTKKFADQLDDLIQEAISNHNARRKAIYEVADEVKS